MGIVSAIDNDYGVTGIAPSVSAYAIPVDQNLPANSNVVANAINVALLNSSPGDVILVEMAAALSGSHPVEGDKCLGQQGSIPMEFWTASFEAIKLAVAMGRIVIEPAGNGAVNLDDDLYSINYIGQPGNAFNRSFRNSGAIFVGASYLLVPVCSTNYGSRVDLQGQGDLVVTTDGGDLFPFIPQNSDQNYSSIFDGTSAAGAIVAGAAIDLQGMAKARGTTLTPAQILQILKDTGTPQPAGTLSKPIGPMPNLLNAMQELPPLSSCGLNAPIVRVSVNSLCQEADFGVIVRTTAVSGDGRFVAYASDSTNLVEGDTNGNIDVFEFDRFTGQTYLVSVSSSGEQGLGPSGAGAIGGVSISSDGRYVAFGSVAYNFVSNVPQSIADIFVHDRITGTTNLVSIAPDGTPANAGSSGASISADGRYIAFSSGANNLVSNDTNNAGDIFVRDQQIGSITRVSVASDRTQANRDQWEFSMSSTGRYVIFVSPSDTLVPNDTNTCGNFNFCYDVFVHDLQTGQTTQVSVASDGTLANGNSDQDTPVISQDGRYAVFSSYARNLTPNDNLGTGARSVYVHDLVTKETKIVSRNNVAETPSISDDGHLIAFSDNPGFNFNHIYLYNNLTGIVDPVPLAQANIDPNSDSFAPILSANGQVITFVSSANNLVAQNTDICIYGPCQDIFLVKLSNAGAPSLPNAVPERNYYTTVPTLTWTHVTWAVRYELQIAQTGDFINAVTYQIGNQSAFTLPPATSHGKYYWRVRACSSVTKCETWSTPDSFRFVIG